MNATLGARGLKYIFDKRIDNKEFLSVCPYRRNLSVLIGCVRLSEKHEYDSFLREIPGSRCPWHLLNIK